MVTCTSEEQRQDAENAFAIPEQDFMTLVGEAQYVEIIGVSPDKPLLLFLHGGPGWPQTPQLRYFMENPAHGPLEEEPEAFNQHLVQRIVPSGK